VRRCCDEAELVGRGKFGQLCTQADGFAEAGDRADRSQRSPLPERLLSGLSANERGVSAVVADEPRSAAAPGDMKKKLIRGGVAVGLLLAVFVGIIALLPGLDGVRSAVTDASGAWVGAAAAIQLAGVVGAVVFVQLVFADVPGRLTWKMGGAQMAANVVMPTAGNTAVGYWTLTSIGWKLEPFAERTAVLIIAPTAPNVLLIIVFGLGMGLHVFGGPHDWWLTFLPAAIALAIIVLAIWAARWGHRLAERTHRRWLREGLRVLSTGVTGTVEVLRRRDWRVIGTWVEIFASIGALWAALIAVGEHLPFAVVAMGFLVGQVAQVVPIPGGIGAIDAGVTGALVLYGANFDKAAAGELIAHALALAVPLLAGLIPFALLPREIHRTKSATAAASVPAQ
jgi:uncharacterized membrane protein YbhN (UPF0104 family)